MTSLSVLETFFSLTAQVTLLICLTAWVVHRQNAVPKADEYWAMLHIGILLLTVNAFFLPHLRLFTWADFQAASVYPVVERVFSVLGRFCGSIWISGAIVIIAVCVGGMIKASQVVRGATVDEQLRQHLLGLMPVLALTPKQIEIRVSDSCAGPFCWHLQRPVIALPEMVLAFPDAEQTAIVRHELAHLQLQHPLHLFLQRLVEAIYWYHPLVWWASRQAAAAREIRCDRAAVSSHSDVVVYLRSLLRLIEAQFDRPGPLPANLGFLSDTSSLSRRACLLADSVEHFNQPIPKSRPAIWLAVTVSLCVLIWLPVNPHASRRADWSPWPSWTAQALDATGIAVRDYEVDGHRLDSRKPRK